MVQRDTEEGPVTGVEHEHYLFFGGIPYAQKVVPDLRFKAPQPAVKRDQPLDCSAFRATAIHKSLMFLATTPQQSDDCLFLNIWTPKETTDSKQWPVLFWIHGGSYASGSGCGYRGARLCEEQKIVVVTINYRLNFLGFTNWKDVLQDPLNRFDSNVGIRDQMTALLWVHRNIANFGGNPEDITLAGQSAGSSSVLSLITMSDKLPLIKGAIMQSGSLTLISSREASQRKAKFILKCLLESVLSGKGETQIQYDRNVLNKAIATEDYSAPVIAGLITSFTTQELQDAVEAGRSIHDGRVSFGAWYDQDLLPSGPEDVLERIPSNLSLLIGHCKEEESLWKFYQLLGVPTELPLTATDMAPLMSHIPPSILATVLRHYQQPGGTVEWDKFSRDLFFVNTTRRVADEAALRGAKVYRYRIDAIGSGLMKAAHGVEIYGFWDGPIDPKLVQAQLGIIPEPFLKTMRDHWGNHVKTGSPGWELYEPHTRRVMIFDSSAEPVNRVVHGLNDEEPAEKIQDWQPLELHPDVMQFF